jgi:nucleoside-diphosphate-sugar epimerase
MKPPLLAAMSASAELGVYLPRDSDMTKQGVCVTTYLVTGGGGFIGSHLIDHVLRAGIQVRVLDNFATGHRTNLAHCDGDIELVEGDLRSADTVRRAVQGCEVVLHQGALPSIPRSIADPVTSNAVNVEGTLHVLQAARDAGVRRVVVASSSSVYGDTPVLPKEESMALNPRSPYAVSKLAAESYTRIFAGLYGIETVALRYFNVFGPRQDPRSQYAGVIARLMMAALHDTPFTVNGDGTQSRDFTYVDNVVRANLLAATAPNVSGEVFNVAAGTRLELNHIIATLTELVRRPLRISHGPPRAGDVQHSLADITKARTLLQYEPAISAEDGLALTLDWYRQNEGRL